MFPQYTSQHAFEIIHSRSSASAQLAARESTTPFLSGTKPPVSDLEGIEKLGTDDEHFRDAGLVDLFGFVLTKFGTKPTQDSVISKEVFVIIDEQSTRDGSARLVYISNDMTSPTGFSYEVDSVRMGFDQCMIEAQTVEKTSCAPEGLQMSAAKDGIFWGHDFTGKDPPPMSERPGVGEGAASGVR